MTPEQLLIKIKALDLLIDEVLEDITNDDALAALDESCEADKAASLLQDYLETLAETLQKILTKGAAVTTYQIVTTTRAGIEYGPEFSVEDAIANLIDNNLDYFIEKLLDEKPEQLINNINQKGTEND